jgi:hypothetical protein
MGAPRTSVVLVLMLIAVGGGACGGGASSNGEVNKAAAQILDDAKAAVREASSMRIVGQGVESGQPTSLEVTVTQNRGGGSITARGATLQVVSGAGEVYVKADAASWLKLTGKPAAATLFADRWVKAPATDAHFAGIADLVDLSKLVAELKPEGQITKEPLEHLDGTTVIPLVDSTGSTVYVAASGPSYILKVVNTSKSSGGAATITFDRYGHAAIPAIPTGAVDLSQLNNG